MSIPPRRTSMRLASAREDAERKESAQATTAASAAAPRNRNRPTIEVAIPVKTQSASSSSRSSVDNVSGIGTNQRSTPATSVAITPAESDVNKPNKRVSASARARELRSNAMSLGTTQKTRKRNASAILKAEIDEAIARVLQEEEYRETKRPRLSSEEDTDSLAGLESATDSEDFELQPRKGRKPRHHPRITIGPEDLEALDDDSSGIDTDTDTESLSEEEEEPLPPRPQRSRGGAASARGRNARRSLIVHPQGIAQCPQGMSKRVCRETFFQTLIPALTLFYRHLGNGKNSKDSTQLSLQCGMS